MKQPLILAFLFIISFAIVSLSCSTLSRKQEAPQYERIINSGIALYKYHKFGEFYCEIERSLIIEDTKFPFFDFKGYNYGVLKKNPKVLDASIHPDSFLLSVFDSNELYNLNNTLYKRRSENRYGYINYNSNSFYKMEASDSIVYISFNIKANFIKYKNIKTEQDRNLDFECCPIINDFSYADFFVLDSINNIYPLDLNQQNHFLFEPIKLDSLSIFLCE